MLHGARVNARFQCKSKLLPFSRLAACVSVSTWLEVVAHYNEIYIYICMCIHYVYLYMIYVFINIVARDKNSGGENFTFDGVSKFGIYTERAPRSITLRSACRFEKSRDYSVVVIYIRV